MIATLAALDASRSSDNAQFLIPWWAPVVTLVIGWIVGVSRRSKKIKRFRRRIIDTLNKRWKSTGKSSEPGSTSIVVTDASALHDIKSILLIKTDHIGDFILALPAFMLIKNAFPNAKITLICGHWNSQIATLSDLFDDIVTIDLVSENSGENIYFYDIDNLPPALKVLPSFDLAMDLRVPPDTRFMLKHVNAKFKAGYASDISDELTLALPLPEQTDNSLDRYPLHTRLLLAQLASAAVTAIQGDRWPFDILQRIAATAPGPNPVTSLPGRRVGLSCGSGAETKSWPVERFAGLAKQLRDDHGCQIALFGSQRDANSHKHLSLIGGRDVLDLTGKLSLPDLVKNLACLDAYVGNDTGPTHIAASLGIPALCLFSGMVPPRLFGPSGRYARILTAPTHCAPCGKRDLKDCFNDHACMAGITEASTVQEVLLLLSKAGH